MADPLEGFYLETIFFQYMVDIGLFVAAFYLVDKYSTLPFKTSSLYHKTISDHQKWQKFLRFPLFQVRCKDSGNAKILDVFGLVPKL